MVSENKIRRAPDATLFCAIVDQFVARERHQISEIKQFERLAVGLIDLLDAECVAGRAEILCRHPETPPSVVAKIFDKSNRCTLLVFEFARRLSSCDLLATAEQGGVEFATAIARRADLGRDVVMALASRAEGEVLHALAANRGVYLDHVALRTLVAVGRDDVVLGRILLDREDLDVDPQPLFLSATRAERAAILLQTCRSALLESCIEAAPPASPAFADQLESAARSNNAEAMVALLADALDCRKRRMRAIVADPSGEALALTLLGLGVDVETSVRIFLSADPAISHDSERVRSLVGLMRSTPSRAALRIIGAIIGTGRADRDALRRSVWRDDATARWTGWRRLTRTAPSRSGKRDQSA